MTNLTKPSSPLAAWYTVVLLALAYLISILDRVAISLLVTPIKVDLQLSDTDMGLILGVAFGVFYSLVGLPMGRLVDRYNRRNLIVAAIVTWCVMTILSGLAQNYWHLFFARMGVGIGEAVLAPAAWSMVADLFPPERRAKPLSVIGIGAILGGGVAFIASSVLLDFLQADPFSGVPLLRELAPWRVVLVLAGIPGLLIAVLLLTVSEPARPGHAGTTVAAADHHPSLREVAAFLWSRRSSILLYYFACGLLVLNYYTYTSWGPTVLLRQFGLELSTAGYLFGLCVLIAAPLGTFTGGFANDYFTSRGRDAAYVTIPIVAGAGLVLGGVLLILAPSAGIWVVCMGFVYFCYGSVQAPFTAYIQRMAPPRMRGFASALFVLMVSLVGYVLGPPVVAILSEWLDPAGQSLGLSLVLVCGASALLAILIFRIAFKPSLAGFREARAQDEGQEKPGHHTG